MVRVQIARTRQRTSELLNGKHVVVVSVRTSVVGLLQEAVSGLGFFFGAIFEIRQIFGAGG